MAYVRGRIVTLRAARLAALLGVALALGGCDALGGKGDQPAIYKLPKDKSVIVVVDMREELSSPPMFTTTLAEHIASHLYRFKATDHVVGEQRLLELEQKDPVKFRALGDADIARETHADLVMEVYITYMQVTATTDSGVMEASATAQVKVVDRNGVNLWPGTPTGTQITAKVDWGLSTDRSKDEIYKELSDQLSTRTGRMFHTYSLDDKEMTLGEMRIDH